MKNLPKIGDHVILLDCDPLYMNQIYKVEDVYSYGFEIRGKNGHPAIHTKDWIYASEIKENIEELINE